MAMKHFMALNKKGTQIVNNYFISHLNRNLSHNIKMSTILQKNSQVLGLNLRPVSDIRMSMTKPHIYSERPILVKALILCQWPWSLMWMVIKISHLFVR